MKGCITGIEFKMQSHERHVWEEFEKETIGSLGKQRKLYKLIKH